MRQRPEPSLSFSFSLSRSLSLSLVLALSASLHHSFRTMGGGTAKWIKCLITGLKKKENNPGSPESIPEGNYREARCLLRKSATSKEDSRRKLRRSFYRKVAPVDFAALAEAFVRVPLKEFQVLKNEWAATRVQASFRGFLARRALRALKAVVRIQAHFRGQQVRKQMMIAFRRMEAVVLAQIRLRKQRANTVTNGGEMQFEAARPSTSSLEVLSEKGHQHLHNINNGSLSFERAISAKPDKKLNDAAEARLKWTEEVSSNNHHNCITLTEFIEAKKRNACSRSYRELQCDMEAKKRNACAGKMSRSYRELRRDMD